MSVPDMIRNMTRFAEKAKDLPLHMLQTALSGVGQALLLGDRVRTRIKGLAGQDEDLDKSRDKATAPSVDLEERGGEKPARREPVIFAPRPEKAAPQAPGAGSNGAKAPEPVIFTPAKPAKPAVTETAEAPAPKAETVEAAAPVSEAKPAKPAKPEPVEAEAPAEAKVAEAEVSAPDSAATKPAEPEVSAPKAVETETPKPAEAEVAEAAVPASTTPEAGGAEATAPEAGTEVAAPAAGKAKPRASRAKATKTKAADDKAAEVTETEAAKPAVDQPLTEAVTVPAEPMPGYAELTVASLRARMRGKTAVQIQELLAYERATSARDAVVRMYENRLAKLEAAE